MNGPRAAGGASRGRGRSPPARIRPDEFTPAHTKKSHTIESSESQKGRSEGKGVLCAGVPTGRNTVTSPIVCANALARVRRAIREHAGGRPTIQHCLAAQSSLSSPHRGVSCPRPPRPAAAARHAARRRRGSSYARQYKRRAGIRGVKSIGRSMSNCFVYPCIPVYFRARSLPSPSPFRSCPAMSSQKRRRDEEMKTISLISDDEA